MSTSNDWDNTTRDGVLLKEGDPVFFLKSHQDGRIPNVMEGVNRGGCMVWVGASEGPVNWGYSRKAIAIQGALSGDRQGTYAKVRDITDGQIIRILDSFSEEHPADGERWGFDTALGDTAKLIRVVRRILSTRDEGAA